MSLQPRPTRPADGPDVEARRALRLGVVRVLVVVSVVLGVYYATWRWTSSINWAAWWIGVPLVVAETYSLLDSFLFGVTVWRLKQRGDAPPPPPGATVDVFITTYNEPVELVQATARAARDIAYPHKTWVLDDGARDEMRAAAEEIGVGYITRTEDWRDRPRHAKAGNLNNALFATDGEFLLILDADQVPDPAILDRTLGWFRNERVALVQTPQWFSNVTESDPLGSQAPLFYGPIQMGKDGWNAAFFCGSNAILRREALMQLGVVGYVRGVRNADMAALRADLEAIRDLPVDTDSELNVPVIDDAALDQLARRQWSPLGALESVQALVRSVDVDRDDEAQPVMPLATISVTEDMATAMRLHGMGWESVYHHEILAVGLAPEDLGTMLQQRLRWAQGTLQVLLRENPMVQPGLSWGQRLMYMATMWTYLAGFAAVAYLVAPILYLCVGVSPVAAYGPDFVWHLAPYLVVNQLLFLVVGYGTKTWRGQQYSLALFPLWIRACATAVGNVVFRRSLGFVVTPKTRQEGGPPWRLIRPQLVAMGVLVLAAAVGLIRLAAGAAPSAAGTFVNVGWVAYDLLVLSVIIDAAMYRGPEEAG